MKCTQITVYAWMNDRRQRSSEEEDRKKKNRKHDRKASDSDGRCDHKIATIVRSRQAPETQRPFDNDAQEKFTHPLMTSIHFPCSPGMEATRFSSKV